MRLATFVYFISIFPAYAIGLQHGGTPVPAAAESAGYTINTFHTGPFTTSNVDTAGTYSSGFLWYVPNINGFTFTTTGFTVNSDGSLTVSPPLGTKGGVSSIGKIVSAPYFVGNAFGCGGYFTAEISFDPFITTTVSGWPAWWSVAAENTTDNNSDIAQWPGQVSGYDHHIELDIFEYDLGAGRYGSTMHDWYGLYGVTCPPNYCDGSGPTTMNMPTATDLTLYHRYAALWVPATGSTNGYMNYYFDDIPLKTPIPNRTWTQYSGSDVPPAIGQTWEWGIIDVQHLALILSSGNTPMNIRSVDVWQGPGACNISN